MKPLTRYALVQTYGMAAYHLKDCAARLHYGDESGAIEKLKKQFCDFHCKLQISETADGYALIEGYADEPCDVISKETDIIREIVNAFQISCSMLTTNRNLRMFVKEDKAYEALYSYAGHIRSDDYDPYEDEDSE